MKRIMLYLMLAAGIALPGCDPESPDKTIAEAVKIELYGAYNIGMTGSQFVEYIAELKPEELEAIKAVAQSRHFSTGRTVKYAAPFAYLKVYLPDGTQHYCGIDYAPQKDNFRLYYHANICSMAISAYQISILNPDDNKLIKEILARNPGSSGSEYQNRINAIAQETSAIVPDNGRNGIIPLLWAKDELRPGFVFRPVSSGNTAEQFIFIWKNGNQYNFSYDRDRMFRYNFTFSDDLSSCAIDSISNFAKIQHVYRNGMTSSVIKEQYFNPDQKFREYRIEPEKLSPLPLAPREAEKYIAPLFADEPTGLKHIANSGDLEIMQYGENQILVNADSGMIYRIEFIPAKDTCLISVKDNGTTFLQISINDNQITQLIGNEQDGFIRTEFDNSNCTVSYINNNNGEWILRENTILQ